MIGSVYDPVLGRYQYYKLHGSPGNPWQQPGSRIGTGVEDALPQVPLGSQIVGNGEEAIGPVLRPPIGGITNERLTRGVLLGLGAFFLWRMLTDPNRG